LVLSRARDNTNTLGEMYTLLRFQAAEALRTRGVHEFDAWASAFGDTRTELELQPSGSYKPVERFSEFVNVPELSTFSAPSPTWFRRLTCVST
jgi:N12 class adenine-specific DNA methylase